MEEKVKIIVVEDDESIVEGLKYILDKEGFTTTIARTKAEALILLEKNKYDILLVDVQLPDGKGFDICKYVKENKDIPVILSSAIGEEANVVYGLDIGADDFIIKPYRNYELIARINCVLRRAGKNNLTKVIVYRNLYIDTGKTKVYTKEGKDIVLTSQEYRLLIFFLKNINRTISREEILDKVWDIDYDYINDNTLSVYIGRLRQKIDDGTGKESIKTVHGIGYRMLN